MKKLRNKQRKAQKKLEKEKEKQKQEQEKKEHTGGKKQQEQELDGPKEEDLIPDKLAKVRHLGEWYTSRGKISAVFIFDPFSIWGALLQDRIGS